jgi:phenylpropionate dioxygenase-like ring-hydroxylating dioxygenase large terminal subunit
VYLPQPSAWYPFNLRVDSDPNRYVGEPLQRSSDGGSTITWAGSIDWSTRWDNEDSPQHLPYVTPMYVREGGIIPQIGCRLHVPTKDEVDQNPITIHVYPGANNVKCLQFGIMW